MANVKLDHDWNMTSVVLCLIANVNRDPNKPAFHPKDFNPRFKDNSDEIIHDSKSAFQALKKVFTEKPKAEINQF